MRGWAHEHRLSPAETLAVGNGANDIAMIEATGLVVGYHPVPAVAEVADAVTRHNDLTALPYAQGYRRDTFVEVWSGSHSVGTALHP
ncbi:MAG: HAD hydrolase family protein [Rhodospirillales bacterium]|nr:HAD hydrolase family protein [Rhodospirillales bacterium]